MGYVGVIYYMCAFYMFTLILFDGCLSASMYIYLYEGMHFMSINMCTEFDLFIQPVELKCSHAYSPRTTCHSVDLHIWAEVCN